MAIMPQKCVGGRHLLVKQFFIREILFWNILLIVPVQ